MRGQPPLGLENSISEGVVSNAKRTIDDMTFIQISAPISPGSSGGAVLDEQCQVIGISTAGFVEGQNLNLAVPSNLISTITRGAGTTLATLFPPKPTPTPGSSNASAYYPENSKVPNYTYVTGTAHIDYDLDEEKHIVTYAYPPDADDFVKYGDALIADGYKLYDKDETKTYLDYFFTKGDQMVLLSANVDPDVILVIFADSNYTGGSSTSTTKITYYPEAPQVPDYGSVTGARLAQKAERDSDDGYIYVYAFDEDQVIAYFNALKDEGFSFYAQDENKEYNYVMYTYVKGRTMVSVAVSPGTNQVLVLPLVI